MIEVVEIEYSCGKTLNMGGYESTRVDASAKARLGKGDNEETAFKMLRSIVIKWIDREEKRIRGDQ